MDERRARRDAQRVARDLIRERATAVGDLGVAINKQLDAVRLVEHATRHAEDLVVRARGHGAEGVRLAEITCGGGRADYLAAYAAARDAGWTCDELTAMGYTQPAGPRRRRRSTPVAGTTTKPDPAQGKADHQED